MGLVVTLKITEIDENRMVMKRSRFPKAMGIMMLCISFVFIVMYIAAKYHLEYLYHSPSILDKMLYFAIISFLFGFPILGFCLLFYDKNIIVDKNSGRFAYGLNSCSSLFGGLESNLLK